MSKKISLLSIPAVLVLSLAVWLLPAAAQQGGQPSGQGLEITPPLVELDADPGETKVIEIGVRNITEIDVIARGEVNDFTARDETGDPRILLDTDAESPYPLASYVAEVPDLEIAPTEQEVVRIPITVPEDASPGAHTGVVRFSAIPADSSEDSSQVSLSASIGTLVLLHVNGDAEYSLSMEELSIEQDGEASDWFETGPLTIVNRLENEGNVFLQPSGTLKLTNIFGREVGVTELESEDAEPEDDSGATEIAFNPTERYIMPESIRRFENSLDKDFWFGRYTVTADFTYGPDGTQLSATEDFWVIPYKLLAIALVLLIVVGVFGRKSLKAYRSHVIKKYQQQSGGGNSTPTGQGQSPQGPALR